MIMNISENGLRFIADHEGMVLHLYNDPAGHCTVGIGHLVHVGPCSGLPSEAPFQGGISEEQALNLLREDVARFEVCINENVGVPLNQNQFDALVSFAFNIGCAGFRGSSVLTVLNQGLYHLVCERLKLWVHGGGVVLPGLVTRREDECNLFETPVESEDAPMTPEERQELNDLKAELRRFKHWHRNNHNPNLWKAVGNLRSGLRQGLFLLLTRIEQEHPPETSRAPSSRSWAEAAMNNALSDVDVPTQQDDEGGE